MSHGPGRVQRAVLDLIAAPEAAVSFDHESHPHAGGPGPVGVPLSAVFGVVYGTDEPTRAQRAAVGRAVRVLGSRGLVETYSRRWCPERHSFAGNNYDRATKSWGCCGRPHELASVIGRPRTAAENDAKRQAMARARAVVRRVST